MSTCIAQILASNAIDHGEEPQLFREMANSRDGPGVRGEHRMPCYIRKFKGLLETMVGAYHKDRAAGLKGFPQANSETI